MAFGVGVLISAVAFELVLDAYEKSLGGGGIAFGLLAGCATFFGGDALIDRPGGAERKIQRSAGVGLSARDPARDRPRRDPREHRPRPHQRRGRRGRHCLPRRRLAVEPSEAVASSTGLAAGGWARARILGVWVAVMLVSGLAALAGYGLFDGASPSTLAFVNAFAAGAILTMLADTMMPEAFEHGGKLVGIFTTFGFAVAFALSTLE